MKLKPKQIILICLVLLATSYLLLAIGRWWLADKHFANGKKLADAGYVSQAFPELERAVQLMPQEPLFHDGLSDVAAKIAFSLSQQEATATESARQFQALAVAESTTTLRLNRVHLNFWKTRIRNLLILAQLDPQFYSQALEALNQSLVLSPTDAKLTYNLALVYQQLGQLDTARQTLEKTIALKSNYEAARYALGLLYQETGLTQKAKDQFEYILNFLNPQNATVKQALDQLQ